MKKKKKNRNLEPGQHSRVSKTGLENRWTTGAKPKERELTPEIEVE